MNNADQTKLEQIRGEIAQAQSRIAELREAEAAILTADLDVQIAAKKREHDEVETSLPALRRLRDRTQYQDGRNRWLGLGREHFKLCQKRDAILKSLARGHV